MRMEGSAFIGLALGAWGAVQSTGAGLAMFLGGALRDGVAQLQAAGVWGAEFADPAIAYSVVYHVEMLLLFITLVAVGPLVSRRGALALQRSQSGAVSANPTTANL
jgi:BCD family chlorophyll transporter-like MFS transporter